MIAYQEKVDDMYRKLIEEMYGVNYDTIMLLSNICKEIKVNWFDLFYATSKEIENFPKKSIYRKDKIAKLLFKDPFGILLNHTPCGNLDKVVESWRKVKMLGWQLFRKRRQIVEICKNINLGF
jgi:hypothetical protein